MREMLDAIPLFPRSRPSHSPSSTISHTNPTCVPPPLEPLPRHLPRQTSSDFQCKSDRYTQDGSIQEMVTRRASGSNLNRGSFDMGYMPSTSSIPPHLPTHADKTARPLIRRASEASRDSGIPVIAPSPMALAIQPCTPAHSFPLGSNYTTSPSIYQPRPHTRPVISLPRRRPPLSISVPQHSVGSMMPSIPQQSHFTFSELLPGPSPSSYHPHATQTPDSIGFADVSTPAWLPISSSRDVVQSTPESPLSGSGEAHRWSSQLMHEQRSQPQ